MSGMAGCREIRQALGVYVLGAIDPAERAQVDEHLATCADCREELASLAGLPAMLRKVPVVEAERLAATDSEGGLTQVPSEALLTSLVTRTANVRRFRRWRTAVAVAAAAVVALAGGVAVTNALQPGPPVASWPHRASGAGLAGAVLTVKYRGMAWGTEMLVNVKGLKPGSVCTFEVTDKTGETTVVGSWVSWSDSFSYPASVWISNNDLHSFEVAVKGTVVASAVT
jgi:hypothetical protein